MEFKDYYKILGITEDADLKEIKKVYRKLALKLHPDVNQKDDAGEKFKEVGEAYEVLKNPKRRAEYDELRKYKNSPQGEFNSSRNWQNTSGDFENGQGHADFSEFFNSMFGGGGFDNASSTHRSSPHAEQFAQKGQDAEIEVPVFLEDTIAESSKTIQFSIPTVENGQIKQISKTLKVKIPMGVLDNDRIRLKGQGGPGYGQGPNGDLYLHIKLVPHPIFDVEVNNLIISIPLLPWEAALGKTITVPTLSGKIKLNVKPNSQTGHKLKIKGKGLKGKQGTGDMIAVIKIVIPPEMTEDDKALWQKFENSNAYNPRAAWSN